MSEIPVNYMAVLVSGVASMVLGSLWYGPVFGKQWMKLAGIGKEKIESDKKKGMAKLYALAFAASLVTAYVFSHILVFASSYMAKSGAVAGISTGFWLWLGFVAPVTLGVVLWEGKSWKLWCLNNTYTLVNFIIVGIILASWK